MYDDQVLLNAVNEWIKNEGQEAKNELEKKANYNWVSEKLNFLLSQD